MTIAISRVSDYILRPLQNEELNVYNVQLRAILQQTDSCRLSTDIRSKRYKLLTTLQLICREDSS